MRTAACLSILALACILAPAALADAVIITTEGKVIKVAAYARGEDSVSYETRRADGKQAIPAEQVEAIFERPPMAVDQLSGEEVDAVLAEMARVGEKFPETYGAFRGYERQFNRLKKTFDKAAASVEKHRAAIDTLIAQYTYSDRGPEVYTQVVTNLDMISYEDLQNTYADEIAKLKDRIRADFLRLNTARLGAQVAALETNAAIPDYIAARQLSDALMAAQPNRRQSQQIDAIIDHAEATTIAQNLAKVRATIGDAPDIDAYLAANTRLRQLKRLAGKPELKEQVQELGSELDDAVTAANPGYSLSVFNFEGYPMTEEDQALVAQFGQTLTYLNRGNTDHYRAIAFLTAEPVNRHYLATMPLKIRLIFHSTPTTLSDYRIVFWSDHDDKPLKAVPITGVEIKNGHGDGSAEVSLADMNKKVLRDLREDANMDGDTRIMAQIEASPNGGKDWRRVTPFMHVQLNVAEEPPVEAIEVP